MKICAKCKVEQPVSEFYKRPAAKDGCYSYCKECDKARAAAWRKSNPDKLATMNAAWRNANPEKSKAKATAWYKANREMARAAHAMWRKKNAEKHIANAVAWGKRNPDKRAVICAAWAKRNPEKCAAKTAEREAQKLMATPDWADSHVIDEFYFTANELGKLPGLGDGYHVDHIVPLRSKVVCGLHCEHNLQILEAQDNERKGNRHWPDMPKRYNSAKAAIDKLSQQGATP